jgi:hypothetical protein
MTTLQPDWQLTSLNITFMTYGDYSGKYVGKVEFANRQRDAFVFTLSPEETQQYMTLISEKLVSNASNLGDKLLASLNLLPAPKTVELIANDKE